MKAQQVDARTEQNVRDSQLRAKKNVHAWV